MRSYETSRTIFGFIEFLAWCGVVGGGFMFLAGMSAIFGERGFGGQIGVILMIPGVIFLVFGLLTVVMVQTARAGVDTAELSGQMLKVARDQLEVSKQALRASEAAARTYEGLAQKAAEDRPLADFGAAFAAVRKDTGDASLVAKAANGIVTDAGTPSAVPGEDAAALPHGAIVFLGHTILPQAGNYWVGEQFFTSLDAAKRYVQILKEE